MRAPEKTGVNLEVDNGDGKSLKPITVFGRCRTEMIELYLAFFNLGATAPKRHILVDDNLPP